MGERITDELRNEVFYAPMEPDQRGRFNAIADRIDAAHERLCSRSRSNGYGDGFTDGFNDIESWVVDHEDEMADLGWVRLPKDADGEYIHIGDRMENNERVARIVLTDDSWKPSVYLEKLPNVLHEYFCNEISHYHVPTVEDVLQEFAQRWDNPMRYDRDELVEQYAAKLRLTDDGKEQ